MVDMVTTQENDFGHILDPNWVPAKKQDVIGDHYFELEITMEKVGFDENGEEVDMDFGDDGDGGQGKGEDNAKQKEDVNTAKNASFR